MLDNKDQVSLFLELQEKSIEELRQICQKSFLIDVGESHELIDRILSAPKDRKTLPALIPLRTRNDSGKTIPEALEAIKGWRKQIFDNNSRKNFLLTNSKDESYTLNLGYIKVIPEIVISILFNKWYLPVESQVYLLGLVILNPNSFIYHIVQKPDSKGNNWIMIHIQKEEINVHSRPNR